jgi:hypothetical protein
VPQKVLTNFAWPPAPSRRANGLRLLRHHQLRRRESRPPRQGCSTTTAATGTLRHPYLQSRRHGHLDLPVCSWRKMDNDDVVIVAGAPGTIISRTDGNFDRSCALSNAPANEVDVQHADGSVASYRHMKSGSPHVQGLSGDTVVTGVVPRDRRQLGQLHRPHLHLEFYDASNNLVDPWLGTCNSIARRFTWAKQRPYRDPAVLALTVGTGAPDCSRLYQSGDEPSRRTTSLRGPRCTSPPTCATSSRRRRSTGASCVPTAASSPRARARPRPSYTLRYAYSFFTSFRTRPGTWTFELTLAGKL